MGMLKGKTLFITGASRGIGLAIARRAARDGANIAIAAKTAIADRRLPGTIYSAAQEIEEAGGVALPLICDVRDEDQIQRAVGQAMDRFGGIDVCINNASAISLTQTLQTETKRYDLMHQVNARGTFLVTKACIPHLLRADNPHVLNLAPPLVFDLAWFEQHAAYALSKFGMSLYAMAMAREFSKDGIAFNTLWPRTTIATAALRKLPGTDALVDRSRRPEIMADAAYFIITQPSREFTGNQCIDDRVLAAAGINDLRRYRVAPGTGALAADLFVPDSMPEPAGVLV